MMTNRPFGGGAPFTLGDPAISRSAALPSSGVMVVNLHNPAPRGGVVSQASVYLSSAGVGRFVTGTWDGTNFTVSAVSAELSGMTGLNTLTVDLAVPSGGCIAWWQSTATIRRETSGGSSVFVGGLSSPPTAGAAYAGTAGAALYSLEGTGS